MDYSDIWKKIFQQARIDPGEVASATTNKEAFDILTRELDKAGFTLSEAQDHVPGLLKDAGFDGITFHDPGNADSQVFLAFDPEGSTAQEVQMIKTINAKLEGKTHPKTGVPFKRREVMADGKLIFLVAPEFESLFDALIPEELYLKSDHIQFKECNKQLLERIKQDESLRARFTPEQIQSIESGKTPANFTWHHDVETGRLQLVSEEIHNLTNHTGGRNVWGGGTSYR